MRNLWLTLTFIFIFAGCDDSMPDQSANTPADSAINSSSDAGDLANFISLPRQPQTVEWEQSQHRQGNDSGLVARLHFSDADYEYILQNSTRFEVQSNELVEKTFYDRWIAGDQPYVGPIENQGEFVVLTNIHAMEPNLFTQKESSPFIHGRMIPLGDGVIILSLYTM